MRQWRKQMARCKECDGVRKHSTHAMCWVKYGMCRYCAAKTHPGLYNKQNDWSKSGDSDVGT